MSCTIASLLLYHVLVQIARVINWHSSVPNSGSDGRWHWWSVVFQGWSFKKGSPGTAGCTYTGPFPDDSGGKLQGRSLDSDGIKLGVEVLSSAGQVL